MVEGENILLTRCHDSFTLKTNTQMGRKIKTPHTRRDLSGKSPNHLTKSRQPKTNRAPLDYFRPNPIEIVNPTPDKFVIKM